MNLCQQFLRPYLAASACVFLCAASLAADAPTDNPVATRYGADAYPWSDQLPWGNVFSILDYGGVADGSTPNDAAYLAALDAATAAGGGVVYFPEGTYAFADSIGLRDNIVLRGDNPTIGDAMDPDYRPPSQLVFPRFVFDPEANNGTGNDPAAAFKGISMYGGQSGRNVGVINLDLNRAWLYAGGGGSNSAHIVVMGVRSNNVATRQSWEVPTPQQHPWQIHANRFAYNISAFAFRDVLVANNRLNDAHYWIHRQADGETLDGAPSDLAQLQIDDFAQPGFLIRHESNGSWLTIEARFPGGQYVFSYTDHYGIRVTGSTGEWGAAPWIQPNLFYRNRDIRDNWVYTTMRTKIAASGTALIIRDNMLLDRRKKLHFVHPNGSQVVQNAATLENRGIDWRGHDVLIENNFIDVHRHRLRTLTGYPSVDGEGILHQEVHGTTIDGVTIRGNVTSSYIGIWKMPYVRNVLIEDNILTQNNIGDQAYVYVHSNTNGRDFPMFNVQVRNNEARGDITLGAGYHAPGVMSATIEGNRIGGQVKIEDHMVEFNNTRTDGTTPATVVAASGSIPIETPAEGIFFADRDVESMQAGESATLTVLVTNPSVNVSHVNFYNYKTLIGTASAPPYSIEWTSSGTMPFLSAEIRQPDQPGNLRLYTALLPSDAPQSEGLPTVALSVADSPGGLVAPANLLLVATVTPGASPVERVEFYSAGTFLGAVPTDEGPLAFAWSNVARGTYSLTCKVWDQSGAVVVSDPVVVVVHGIPDAAPSDLIAMPYSEEAIFLEWQSSASNATGYRIERSPAGSAGWQVIGETNEPGRSYMDSGLPSETSFDYRVVAINPYGQSPASNVASAATFALEEAAPVAPETFSANTLPGNRIELSWQSPADAYGLRLEFRMDEAADWQLLEELPAATNSTIQGGLEPSARVFYRIRARNNMGASAWAHAIGAVFASPMPVSFASNGSAWPIPGRVEVEDYNPGGFWDATPSNEGNSNYRAPDPVGIANGASNRNIGWIETGEWLEYTVEVEQAGLYTIAVAYASPNASGQLDIHFNGTPVIPRITFANTGAWGTYATHTVDPVYLNAGMYLMRLVMANAGFNLDFVDFNMVEPASYTTWRDSKLADHPLAGPLQDANGDGTKNALKLLFGQDPLAAQPHPVQISQSHDMTHYRFPVSKGMTALDWWIEFASDLDQPSGWTILDQSQVRLYSETPTLRWLEASIPHADDRPVFIRVGAEAIAAGIATE